MKMADYVRSWMLVMKTDRVGCVLSNVPDIKGSKTFTFFSIIEVYTTVPSKIFLSDRSLWFGTMRNIRISLACQWRLETCLVALSKVGLFY